MKVGLIVPPKTRTSSLCGQFLHLAESVSFTGCENILLGTHKCTSQEFVETHPGKREAIEFRVEAYTGMGGEYFLC